MAEEAMCALQIYARKVFMPSNVIDAALATEEGKRICMDYIRNFIQEEGPFYGVIETSQGATVAAMVLLDDLDMSRKENRVNMFECGVFFVGFPPISLKHSLVYVLSNESDTRITILICHVIGGEDIWDFGAVALKNVCDLQSTTVITHGKGHVVSHTVEAIVGVAKFIREISRRRRWVNKI